MSSKVGGIARAPVWGVNPFLNNNNNNNVKRRRGDKNLNNAMNINKGARISQPWGRIMYMYSRTFSCHNYQWNS